MSHTRKVSLVLFLFCMLLGDSPIGAEEQGAEKINQQTEIKPLPTDKGGLVMTFDDRNFDDWVKAIPLFEEFGVRATFFIYGNIDRKAFNAIQKLREKNHAIGSHSVHHLKAVEFLQKETEKVYLENEITPQLESFKTQGVPVSSFAYPMSRNNEATDQLLLKEFRHIRTGRNIEKGKKLCEDDAFFVPVEEISQYGCLNGKGIDFAPTRSDRTFEQIDEALERAAKNREILVLYAHRIADSAKGNHITPEALIRIFSKANELELNYYTFDDLP